MKRQPQESGAQQQPGPKLIPINAGRHFGGAKVSPLQQPAPPVAALAQRRKSERLQIASSATPIRNSTVRRGEPYTCPELAPYSTRAGALDAYALPSITMGRRVEPRRPGHGN